MKQFFKGVSRTFIYILSLCLVLICLTFIVIGFSVPYVGHYKNDIESWLTNYLKHPLIIENIDARWQGASVVFQLENIKLLTTDEAETITELDAGSINISLFESLTSFAIKPNSISISGLKLDLIRQVDGSIVLKHANSQASKNNDENKVFAEWLLSQSEITLENTEIHWLNQQTNKDLLFSNVMATLNASNKHLLAHAQTNINNNPEQHINIDFDISNNILSSDWNGQIIVNGNYIPLDHFFPNTKEQTSIAEKSYTLTTNWNSASLQDFRLETIVRDAIAPALAIENAEFDTTGFRTEEDLWKLDTEVKKFTTNHGSWPQHSFSMLIDIDKEYKVDIVSGEIPFIQLADVKPILDHYRLLPEQLEALKIDGIIKDMEFKRDGDKKIITASTNNAALSYHKNSLTGVSAKVTITENDDNILLSGDIHSNALNIDDDALFYEAISFKNIKTDFELNKTEHAYTLNLPNIHFTTPGFPINASTKVLFEDGELSPFINLNVDIGAGELATVYQHMPKKTSDKLFNWFKKSVKSGQLESGKVVLEGYAHEFPYDKHDGLFNANLNISNLDLKYDSKWPNAFFDKAILNFEHANMIAEIESGSISEAKVSKSTAKLLPIKTEGNTLLIDTKINGRMKNLYSFLKTSPLVNKSSVQKLLDTELTGKMGLDIALKIPFDERSTIVDGQLALNNTRLSTGFTGLELNKMKGLINFNKHKLSSKKIVANYKGYPVNLSIAPEEKNSQDYVFTLNGHADEKFIIQELISMNPDLMDDTNKIHQYIEGSTDWSLAIKNSDQGKGNELLFSSDMQGLALSLPYPINKKISESTPFALKTTLVDSKFDHVEINFNKKLHTYIDIDNTTDLTVQSIDIALGQDTAKKANADLINIHGNIDRLNIDDWLKVLGTKQKNSTPSSQIVHANVKAKTLSFNGVDFINATINAKKEASGTNIKMDSDFIVGHGFIPTDLNNNAIDLNIHKLVINKTETNKATTTTIDDKANEIPALNITIDEFIYDAMKIGNIAIKTKPNNNGMLIDTINFDYNGVQGNGSGKWLDYQNSSRSDINLNLKSENLSHILTIFGSEASNIKDAPSSIAVDLNWSGSPTDFSIQESNGLVNIDIEKGSLLEVESAAGRVFGLLSITSLPRRLAFDFSDIFGEGYAFDDLTGNFEIDKGNAYTTNMQMRGPSAIIDITGRTGLHEQDYDQTVIITPKVSNSLPLAGAVFGPIGVGVGAVVYMAGEVLESTPLNFNKILSYEYSLTGSWDEPIFKKIKNNNIAEQDNNKIKDAIN